MREYLVSALPILMLSVNVSANIIDIDSMTQEENRAKNTELFESIMADTTEQKCVEYREFRDISLKLKKADLMDMNRLDQNFKVSSACEKINVGML
jgi:hypothetical protein